MNHSGASIHSRAALQPSADHEQQRREISNRCRAKFELNHELGSARHGWADCNFETRDHASPARSLAS